MKSKRHNTFIDVSYIILAIINLYFIFLTTRAADLGVQTPLIVLALIGSVVLQVLISVLWVVCEEAIMGTYQKKLEEGEEDDF